MTQMIMKMKSKLPLVMLFMMPIYIQMMVNQITKTRWSIHSGLVVATQAEG